MIIGYTSGVFDMLHIGHLNLLRLAREQCDYLIVGVSTDELCLSYKGKLPVIPYPERKAIVEALRCVDRVIPQTDRNKCAVWPELHYHKLFVGDDWRGSQLFSEAEAWLAPRGAKVVYLPYTHHVSSSKLRDKILQND